MGYKKSHEYFKHDSDPWRRRIKNTPEDKKPVEHLDAELLREALLVCWCELIERSVEAEGQGKLFCSDERLEKIWEEHVKDALL